MGDSFALVRCTTKCIISRILAGSWFRLCSSKGVQYYPSWISGSRNKAADAMSRLMCIETLMEMFPQTKIINEKIKEILATIITEMSIESKKYDDICPGGVRAKKKQRTTNL